jgi:phage/plasmid-associated DNA primase
MTDNFGAAPDAVESVWTEEQVKPGAGKPGDDSDSAPPAGKTLTIGSDVEIAKRVAADLDKKHGQIVFDDGEFYHYDGKRWAALSREDLRKAVHLYDGATYFNPEQKQLAVRLSRGRIDSVLNELRVILTRRNFFADAPTGINCASGFIVFDKDGQPSLAAHDREHGCRHVLPGRWSPGDPAEPPPGSMLYKLIRGAFLGDEDAIDKSKLVGELMGCTALGHATKLRRPKAVIFYGPSAENGKSQLLDATRGLLPKSAISSIPVTKIGDEKFLVRLAGKLLNATDELKGSAAIESDTFKACITGETVTARDVYRSSIEFRPIALNIFGTNTLPGFSGGFDRGVLRRLVVLMFNRVIPNEERIENIGQLIAEKEPDLLLAFAVGGATRLIKQREFTIPSSSQEGLRKWATGADPVLGWVAARVDPAEAPPPGQKVIGIKSSLAHSLFKEWALKAGYRLDAIPAVNGFVQRLEANKTIAGIKVKHTRTGNWLIGLTILATDRDPKDDGIEEADDLGMDDAMRWRD